jgi:hypothetical protein
VTPTSLAGASGSWLEFSGGAMICPEARQAQNSMAAVSADGSTVCVCQARRGRPCPRLAAAVVRPRRAGELLPQASARVVETQRRTTLRALRHRAAHRRASRASPHATVMGSRSQDRQALHGARASVTQGSGRPIENSSRRSRSALEAFLSWLCTGSPSTAMSLLSNASLIVAHWAESSLPLNWALRA